MARSHFHSVNYCHNLNSFICLYLLQMVGFQNFVERASLLRQINKTGIGPMGLGGRTTALAVNIQTYPTHIAGLPVAVNISCHALRSAEIVL